MYSEFSSSECEQDNQLFNKEGKTWKHSVVSLWNAGEQRSSADEVPPQASKTLRKADGLARLTTTVRKSLRMILLLMNVPADVWQLCSGKDRRVSPQHEARLERVPAEGRSRATAAQLDIHFHDRPLIHLFNNNALHSWLLWKMAFVIRMALLKHLRRDAVRSTSETRAWKQMSDIYKHVEHRTIEQYRHFQQHSDDYMGWSDVTLVCTEHRVDAKRFLSLIASAV